MARATLDDHDDAPDHQIDADIMRLTKQAYGHLLFGLLIFLLAIGGFGAGVFALSDNIKLADKLLAFKPENRAGALARQITKTQKSVEQQYAAYEAKMTDESIYDISKKFAVMYRLTQQNEQDYERLLSSYLLASYHIASIIRGSGEWYHYYERELNQFVLRQKTREKSIDTYIARKAE